MQSLLPPFPSHRSELGCPLLLKPSQGPGWRHVKTRPSEPPSLAIGPSQDLGEVAILKSTACNVKLLLTVACTTPPRLREQRCYQPPPRSLESKDKHHGHTLLYSNWPFWHNCWAILISRLEKPALVNTLGTPLLLPLTLVAQLHLLHLVPALHPQSPTCESGRGPLLHTRSHTLVTISPSEAW